MGMFMLGGLLRVPAQDLDGAQAPLVPEAEPPAGPALVSVNSARSALQLGFPALAAELYESILANPDAALEDEDALILEWVTALLDGGRPEEAAEALARHSDQPTAAWRLRVGLTAAAQGIFPAAEAALEETDPAQLSPADRAWFYYLAGMLAAANGDEDDARAAYERAAQLAPSNLARARFVLGELSAQLRQAPVLPDARLATLEANVNQYQGRSIGYQYAETYAAALHARNERDTAIEFLQEHIQRLPVSERAVRDDFRLQLGLIAGAAEGPGRQALVSLLADGADREKQRIALQLLADASMNGAVRASYQALLNRLITAESPLMEDLLLFRAQLALADDRYAEAEADATAVLERFPDTRLKPVALGVLMASAWDNGQYRRAAGYAAQARAEPALGEARAALGVLVAEAYYRAKDYRSASDAYAAAVADVPAGVSAGKLMFQQVLSNIEAGQLAEAATSIDRYAGDPRFDPVSRWKAEWNLARRLQVSGEPNLERAYARVNRLLAASPNETLELPLRVRMAWLQARLAYEAGEPARALELIARLRSSLDALDAPLRSVVASSLALLEAQSNYAPNVNRPATAIEVLRRLRAEYPQTDAAVYSHVIEAEAYAEQENLAEAQRVFVKLADDYPNSRFAPYALLQAALIVRKRGAPREAYTNLEQMVQRYPGSEELVFRARFAQGDILRELNDFGSAQQIYELLVRDFPRHQNRWAAEIALADCHVAQAAADPARLEQAMASYERLQDLPTAPAGLRLEAGFKHGHVLVLSKRSERALQVWWSLVQPYIVQEGLELGTSGRYWMARILFELGSVHEKQGQLEQARDMFSLILRKELSEYAGAARSALTRLGAPPVVPDR